MAHANAVNSIESCPHVGEIPGARANALIPQCSRQDARPSLNKLVPAELGRCSVLGSHRSLPLSPLANGRPRLTTQSSMITMSNDSFRSPSVLDDIPSNLLRRYPRFSTATTSMDTGRPDFSADELTSTELSDDEDAIINDDPRPSPPSARTLMKYKLARDVRALWSSQTSRLRYAKQRVKKLSQGATGQPGQHNLTAVPDPSPATSRAIDDDHVKSAYDFSTPRQETNSGTAGKFESRFPTAAMSANDAAERHHRQGMAPHGRIVGVIDTDMFQCIQATSIASCESYKAATTKLTRLEKTQDDISPDRHSATSPQKMKIKTRSMANLGATKTNTLGQIVPKYECISLFSTRRASTSNIRRSAQPSSRPETMLESCSFSSSIIPQHTETLFIDTPHNPGSTFLFPHKRVEERPRDLGHSRPASHAGSTFSVQTVFNCSVEDACPQVEFEKAMPTGHQRVPAYTIRRIERSDWDGLDGVGLPTLPDSPIVFDEHLYRSRKDVLRSQGEATISRASKWSTKAQTSGNELKEQDLLMEGSANEETDNHFAVKSCHRIARALSNRVGSTRSLPGRFKSRRWRNRATDAADTEHHGAAATGRAETFRVKRLLSGRQYE